MENSNYLWVNISAWSGLPEPENPTGLELFSKPEPEWNPIFRHILNQEKPEPVYFLPSGTRENPKPKLKPAGTYNNFRY